MTLQFDDRILFLIECVRTCKKAEQKVFLVGGAVRDALLRKSLNDLDFVCDSGSMRLARCVQNTLAGEGYTLSNDRQSSRVILDRGNDNEIIMDFVLFSGANLAEDLSHRDFTINAMAVDVEALEDLIDPLDGLTSLHSHQIKLADDVSIQSDPLRSLRAIRFSKELGFSVDGHALDEIRRNTEGLADVAGERVRDELFKLLSLPNVPETIAMLDRLHLTPYVLPDLEQVRKFPRIDPHVHDLWNHTLSLVGHLEALHHFIMSGQFPENYYLRYACQQFSSFREGLAQQMEVPIQTGRSRKGVMLISGLYHDVGKPLTMKTGEDGSVHFYRHPLVADDSLRKVADRLSLSNAELDYLEKMVRNHMRIHTLISASKITDRAIYRYFKDLGSYGIDLVFLSMADTLASREEKLAMEDWQAEVNAGIGMIEAWFARQKEVVDPRWLVDGNDLQKLLGVEPGPLVGRLLSAVHEAQAAGELHSRTEVLAYARRLHEQIQEKNALS